MKAIEYTAFGNSAVLALKDIDKPKPKSKEVLIRVETVSINPLDIKIRSGNMREQIPTKIPYVPGSDVAGIVEELGEGVGRLKVGDRVFATTFGGTYAQYVAVTEETAAHTPKNVGMQESAALAVPLVTSYTFLVQEAHLKAGQKILIHGAAGGVGNIMVQMAKSLGAYVIATATGAGIAIARSAGADEVVDYKNEDFTKKATALDMVFDLVGGDTQVNSFKILKKGGSLFSTAMPPSQELAKQYGVAAAFFSSAPSFEKLAYGANLVEEGKIKPQPIKTFSLEQAAEAQDFLSDGGFYGKVVLVVA